MVVGQIGESGEVAVSHVVAAFKHAHEFVPTVFQNMVVLVAQGIIYSLELAIPMDAQVCH